MSLKSKEPRKHSPLRNSGYLVRQQEYHALLSLEASIVTREMNSAHHKGSSAHMFSGVVDVAERRSTRGNNVNVSRIESHRY